MRQLLNVGNEVSSITPVAFYHLASRHNRLGGVNLDAFE